NTTSTPYDNTQTFTADQSMLKQSGISTFNGNYKYFDGEFSYEIDSLNLITASVDYNDGKNTQESDGLTQTILNNVINPQYYQVSPNNSNYSGVDASVNYQLGFRKSKDQLLTISYQYNSSPFTTNSANMFSDTINYHQPDYRQYNN